MLMVGILVCWWAEAHGNPRLLALGVDPSLGNMEGKEVRFGIANSSIFAVDDHRHRLRRREHHARLVHAARRHS